jgi:hypothetical protein
LLLVQEFFFNKTMSQSLGKSTVADLCEMLAAESTTMSTTESTASTASVDHGALSDLALVLFFLPFGVIPLLIVLMRGVKWLVAAVHRRRQARRPAQAAMVDDDDDNNNVANGEFVNVAGQGYGNNSAEVGGDEFSFRLRLWMSRSPWWTVFTWWVMLLAVLACVVLVVEFYIGVFGASFGLEIFYTVFFIIDYLLRLLSSIDRLRFFFGFWNLADLLSIMPVVLVFFPEQTHTAAGGLLRLLRVSRALRILRAFRFVSARQTGVVSVQQEIVIIFFTLANLIFICSCLILEFERQFSPEPAVHNFHVAVYWMIVTVVTVGFGDLSPKSVESQMMMAFIISCSWFVASLSLAKLIALVRINDKYNAKLRWQDEEAHHVVVSGAITHDSLEHVLRELLTSNKGRVGLRVVVVLPTAPSVDVEQLGRDPRFVVNLQLVVGSLLLKTDLERVRMRNAAACFLLADKYAVDVAAVDTALILQSISIVDHAPALRYSLYVQVLRHDAKRHLIAAGIPNVLSVDELKFGVLGQSCVAPGFSTIINNMLRAYTPKTPVRVSGHPAPFSHWLDEYEQSCGAQPFSASLELFAGQPFGHVMIALFLAHGVTVFAIETTDAARRRIMLKPDVRRAVGADDVAYYIAANEVRLTPETVHSMLEQHRNAFETETSSYERERLHMGEFDSARSLTDSGHVSRRDSVGSLSEGRGGGGGGGGGGVRNNSGAFFNPRRLLSFHEDLPLPHNSPEVKRSKARARLPAQSRMSAVFYDEEIERQLSMRGDIDMQIVMPTARRHRIASGLDRASKDLRAERKGDALIDLINEPAAENDQEDELQDVSDFVLVVVCGDSPNDLFADVLAPLPRDAPIVVVFETQPNDVQWQHIATGVEEFTRLQFVRANPLHFATSSAIADAAKVIVLNGPRSSVVNVATSFDAAALIIARAVETVRRDIFTLVELADGRSIPFIGVSAMLAAAASKPRKASVHVDPNDYMFLPQHAAGLVFTTSVVDTLLCQIYLNPAALWLVKLMVPSRRGAHVYQVQAPATFVGRRVGTLFAFLLVRDILLFGIYRRRGYLSSTMPYVVANPPPSATLRRGDHLYLLAMERPSDKLLRGNIQPFDWVE